LSHVNTLGELPDLADDMYTVGNKKEANLFLSVILSKLKGF